MAIARAALDVVDEVLFVIPRVFPHKQMEGATLEERLALLRQCVGNEPRFSVAVSERGLFLDIARECRQLLGDVDLHFLCGRDAAERILNWDYGDPRVTDSMLDEFSLCVAPRRGTLEHPSARMLHMPAEYDEVSSTEVRERLKSGKPWRHLVPPEIQESVAELYGRG